MRFRCPNCNNNVEVLHRPPSEGDDTEVLECPACHSKFSWSDEAKSTQVSLVGMFIGQFEVQKILGEGAFGTVYLAWDSDLQRHVAVKIPRSDKLTQDFGRQLLREARAAAQIRHPHIVQVYEVGQQGDIPYIVSEYINGISLSEWLRIRNPDPRTAAALMVTICRAVEAAHVAGIVHRDLKPANVLMDQQSQPHVTDFGLARRSAGPDVTITHDGRVVGTPSYMSPEQARGDEQIGPQSDVWSLGVTLFELLTGQRPFKATSSQTVLYRIQTEEVQRPRVLNRAIPRELETITLKALQKDAAARYATAGQLADDLQRHLDGKPIHARRVGAMHRLWKLALRYPVTAALAVIVLLAPAAFVLQAILLTGGLGSARSEAANARAGGDGTALTGDAAQRAKVTTLPVRMAYSLVGSDLPIGTTASWAAARIDPLTWEPIPERLVLKEDVAEFRAELEPGDYLFVVAVKDFGFHEVYRHVPESKTTVSLFPYKHATATLAADGVLELPPVAIWRDADCQWQMVEVPGGRFRMGDGLADREIHERTVDSFLIDPRETTIGEYRAFADPDFGDLELSDEHPVVGREWNEALAYAEYRGKRLLTEAEFEFAATNGGKTAFPAGASAGHDVSHWNYDIAGRPEQDRMQNLPVYGLHSNVAEWTGSMPVPYPGSPELIPELRRYIEYDTARVVRGGPVNLGANRRERNSWTEPVQFRSAWRQKTQDSEIGFRCARSKTPRFLSRGAAESQVANAR